MTSVLFKYCARPGWAVVSTLVTAGVLLAAALGPVFCAALFALGRGHTAADDGFRHWVAGGAWVGLALAATHLYTGGPAMLLTLRGSRATPDAGGRS